MIFHRRKISFVRQRDAMQCGVASLAMVASWWGKIISIDRLETACSVGKDGANLLGIASAAKSIGLRHEAMLLTSESLRTLNLPAILHWRQNHFVVLWKITRNRLYIADPGKGMTSYNIEEFEDAWISTSDGRGIAMTLMPGPDFIADKDPVVRENALKVVASYLIMYKSWLMHVFVGLIIGCVLQLLMPFLTQVIVDRGINGKDIGFIWLIMLGEMMVLAGSAIVDFIRRWILLHISMRVNMSLISGFFIKLFKLPMSFFEIKHMGDILQRIKDHSRVQEFLTNHLLGIFFSLVCFVVLAIALVTYDIEIFIVYILGTGLYLLWVKVFLGQRRIIDYDIFERQSINQNKTYQLITLMQEIKLHNCENRRCQEWEGIQADLFNLEMKSMKLQQTQEAGSLFINELKNIFITVLAASAVIKGEITFGTMLAVQYIIGQLNSPVNQFVLFVYSLQDLKISLDRINEVQHRENEENSLKNDLVDLDGGDIEVKNVTFKYDSNAPTNIIENVNLKIPKGKVTAIVGASGSGKSTLIKLILGYYKLKEGQIKIDGHDLRSMSVRHWRRQCGVVMQDGALFSESIARNIAVNDGDIDNDRMLHAAKLAMVNDYIESLPLKYDTIIGAEGRGLSHGQKQRLLIARAIYRDSGFLFLDEATNSLDAENEKAIIENLQAVFRNKTVVVVAHRLSTVKNADQIVVLDYGRVAEIGTHESLSEKRGIYYSLVKNQLELGQ